MANHKHKFDFVGICRHPYETYVINLLECKCGAQVDGFKKENEHGYWIKYPPSEIAKQLGKLGGNATKKKYGKSHFSKAGKLGMKKRWGKTTS